MGKILIASLEPGQREKVIKILRQRFPEAREDIDENSYVIIYQGPLFTQIQGFSCSRKT